MRVEESESESDPYIFDSALHIMIVLKMKVQYKQTGSLISLGRCLTYHYDFGDLNCTVLTAALHSLMIMLKNSSNYYHTTITKINKLYFVIAFLFFAQYS